MLKFFIVMIFFIFSQNVSALVKVDYTSPIYEINEKKILIYEEQNIYLIDHGVKKNTDISADSRFYVIRINDEIVIIIDLIGHYPTTPILYSINNNGDVIKINYEYKEIPSYFSYNDSFVCEYSKENNTNFNFTCSNPEISKNAKYTYKYINKNIELLSSNDDGVKLNYCNKSYNFYRENWMETKKYNIKWLSGNHLPNYIANSLEGLNITTDQYAQILNNKNLILKSNFKKYICPK